MPPDAGVKVALLVIEFQTMKESVETHWPVLRKLQKVKFNKTMYILTCLFLAMARPATRSIRCLKFKVLASQDVHKYCICQCVLIYLAK